MKKDTPNKEFVFEIKIKLRDGILDPQGNVTYKILKKLNYPIEQVNFDKSIRLTIQESDFQKANTIAEEIASNILVNPVLEYYQISQIQEEWFLVKIIKTAVLVFPGTSGERDAHFALQRNNFSVDYLWHDFDQSLEYDLIFLPGGSSFGDYLRPGAFAKYSNVIKSIEKYVLQNRGLVVGIGNGFQILTEVGLLPGGLALNESNTFICKDVLVEAINLETPFSNSINPDNNTFRFSIASRYGRYVVNNNEIDENQIIFKFLHNPNGSSENIAGIVNKDMNVFGTMLHIERSCHPFLGYDEFNPIFESIRRYLTRE